MTCCNIVPESGTAEKVKSQIPEHGGKNRSAAPHTGVVIGGVESAVGEGKFPHGAGNEFAAAVDFRKDTVQSGEGGKQ